MTGHARNYDDETKYMILNTFLVDDDKWLEKHNKIK